MTQQRRKMIFDMLNAKPFVTLRELEETFPEVSSMTLRRDIEYFEKSGDAIKVRGGARSMKFITTSFEDAFESRLLENTESKERLGIAALDYIEPGRSIFLDSGTTMIHLADFVPDSRLTITTTGINVAMKLMSKKLPIVNVVGGMLNRDNISVSGSQSLAFIDTINIDAAFLVPSGFSLDTGFTGGNYMECELKKKIVEKARYKVLLMDSTKIDKVQPYTFCRMEQIDVLITNSGLSDDIMNQAEKSGVKIILV